MTRLPKRECGSRMGQGVMGWAVAIVLVAAAGPARAGTPASKPALPRGVVAKVGDQTITEKELLDILTQRFAKAAAAELTSMALLKQELAGLGLSVTPEELDSREAQQIAAAQGDQMYRLALAQKGLTPAYYRKYLLYSDLVTGKILEKVKDGLKSDKDYQTFLVERLGVVGSRDLRQIRLVRDELAKQKLAVTDDELDSRVKQVATQMGGEDRLRATLQAQGMTYEAFRKYQVWPELAIGKLAAKEALPKDPIITDDIANRYRPMLLINRLLMAEAARRNATPSEAELAALLANQTAANGGAAKLEEALKARGSALDFYKKYELPNAVALQKLAALDQPEFAQDAELMTYLVERNAATGPPLFIRWRRLNRELARRQITLTAATIDEALKRRATAMGGEDQHQGWLTQQGITVDVEKKFDVVLEAATPRLADPADPQLVSDQDIRDVLMARFGTPILNELVNLALVRQEMLRSNVTVSEADIDARVAASVKQRGGQEKFNQYLQAQNMDLAFFRKFLAAPRASVLKLVKEAAVTEDDVKGEFDERYGERRQIRVIIVRSILVANDVIKQLDAGADFAELAVKYSVDPRAKGDGGLQEPFGRSSLAAKANPLVEETFKLKVGEHTGIIGIDANNYIAKLEKIIPPDTSVTFDQKKDEIQLSKQEEKVYSAAIALFRTLRQQHADQIQVRPDLTGA